MGFVNRVPRLDASNSAEAVVIVGFTIPRILRHLLSIFTVKHQVKVVKLNFCTHVIGGSSFIAADISIAVVLCH